MPVTNRLISELQAAHMAFVTLKPDFSNNRLLPFEFDPVTIFAIPGNATKEKIASIDVRFLRGTNHTDLRGETMEYLLMSLRGDNFDEAQEFYRDTVVENGGISRRPSSTYWNGLRVFDIVRTDKSLAEFCRNWRRESDARESVNSEEGSDDDEQRHEAQVRRPPESRDAWRAGLTLNLSKAEGIFLSERFRCAPGVEHTVAAQLLSNGLAKEAMKREYASFEAFSTWAASQRTKLSETCRENIASAQRFSVAIEGAHIIFNRLIAEAIKDGKLLQYCIDEYKDWRSRAKIAGVFQRDASRQWLSVAEGSGVRVSECTIEFLEQWNVLNCEKQPQQKALDALVQSQAQENKKDRSLLVRLADVSDVWFREHFPPEAAAVAARHKKRLKSSGWRRLLTIGRTMREARDCLKQMGLTFNKDNLERYFGLSIWWSKDEELYERIRAKTGAGVKSNSRRRVKAIVGRRFH